MKFSYKNINKLIKLMWIALPLGIAMMLISLKTNIPRYFVEHYCGIKELGIFAALAYFLVLGSRIVDALGKSVIPRLAKYYAKNQLKKFTKLMLKFMGFNAFIGFIGILLALFFGSSILRIIYSKEYALHADILVWIMFAATISYVARSLGFGMTAVRYFRSQLVLFIIVIVATLSGSIWLIPKYGIIGAAWSLIISEIFFLVGGFIIIAFAVFCKKS